MKFFDSIDEAVEVANLKAIENFKIKDSYDENGKVIYLIENYTFLFKEKKLTKSFSEN